MRLGVYEIIAPLGAGGMGEVYRARDARLGRTVAIKILSPALASSQGFHERFAREAHALAALEHPHICPIFDVGEDQGHHFMVMQHLEGETLATLLLRGRVPVDRALEYAGQLADALAAAHRVGVIHRDVKPGNIMVTRTGVALLDFGLAKLAVVAEAPGGETVTAMQTEPGTVLGTPQYMAPEQIEGRPIDARTDIFALGAVIHEMLTGRAPFSGSSRADLIAAILREDPPPLSALRPEVPRLVDRLVRKCLEKEPDRRWRSAADMADALAWAREASVEPPAVRARRSTWRDPRSWAVACTLAAAAAGIMWWITRAPQVTAEPIEFDIALPSGAVIGVFDSALALSPHGRTLVFSANRNGQAQLFRRSLDSVETVSLAGISGNSPIFSPDGGWVAFSGPRGVARASIDGGTPVEFGTTGAPGGWNDRGELVIGLGGRSGLALLASAGDLKLITSVGPEHGYTSHRHASFLPGGDTVIFTAGPPSEAAWYEADILAQAVAGGRPQLLIKGAAQARYVASGHLVYARAGTLYAVPFDRQTLRVTGRPVAVREGVREAPSQGSAQFAISTNGHLAYVPGGLITSEVHWADRAGRTEPLMRTPPRDQVYQPRLSPDGRYLALLLARGNDDVWIYDLQDHLFDRLTSGANHGMPEWTADGRHVTFSRAGAPMSWRPADRSEPVAAFADVAGSPAGWSRDGQVLVFYDQRPGTGSDILVYERRAAASRPMLAGPHDERAPALSPDGRWLAFSSDESGRQEIYVHSFPPGRAAMRISRDGGTEPRWATDGRELFFRQGNTMMAARLESNSRFASPVALFTLESWSATPGGSRANYDVAADGRFVIVRSNEAADAGTRIRVVLNWSVRLTPLVSR
jgi:serine/threonine-protein kinase